MLSNNGIHEQTPNKTEILRRKQMNKCDCYYTEEQIVGWHTPVDPKIKIVHKCNGTRERDICSCDGERAKCDFYSEVREKALPKFGEWISVEDRLPELEKTSLNTKHRPKSARVLCSCTQRSGKVLVKEGYYELWNNSPCWRIPGSIDSVTHWMPLPEPPKK